MGESRLVSFLRRCIYNRWFYAFLAIVCLIDVASDVLHMLSLEENMSVDVISLVASGIAALLTATIFIDLHSRRGRL